MDIQKYPMLEAHVLDLRAKEPGMTTDAALHRIARYFDRSGPYAYASHHEMLVNNSGEEFAIQFMSAYNELRPGTY